MMARDYQPKKKNPYLMPKNVYNQTLWLIRDYDRMKEEYESMDMGSVSLDGQPRGSSTSDPTARDTIKLLGLRDKIEAIDKALRLIPEEYKKGIWENITLYKRYPIDAGVATYARWKQKFIWRVAKNMYWI